MSRKAAMQATRSSFEAASGIPLMRIPMGKRRKEEEEEEKEE